MSVTNFRQLIYAAVAVCMLAATSLGACGKAGEDNPISPGASKGDRATKAADRLWYESCQACHGPNGRGDGEGARNLHPAPRAMDDSTWQTKITDAQIRRVIIKGGAAVGLSKSMPPTPSLATDRPALDALVKKIRGLNRDTKGTK